MVTRIGVFLPNWVGDVVMATPALRALRGRFADDGQVIGIMRPYVAEVLAGTPWMDQTIIYDRGSVRDMGRLVRALRQAHLDTILLFSNSMTTALLSRFANVPRRIGHAMHGRGWLLTDRPPSRGTAWRRSPRSAVDHYLDVVGILDCDTTSKRPRLATLPDERAAAAAIWRQFGWSEDQPVIVLNTGGAYGAAKGWPAEYFAELARRLIATGDIRILLLCGPSERETVRGICQRVGDRRVASLAERELSIGLSKACVQRSRVMITTDSGPRHFAAAFGVPVVTLFGPTDPRWSDNYHDASIDLQLDISCAPCSRRTCPVGHHRCMRDLTVDHVFAATTSLLDATAPRAA